MLLVNGKRKDVLPKMPKAAEFELVSGFSMENHKVRDAKGNPMIKKNLRYQLPAVYVKFDEGANQNVEYRYAVQEIPIQTGKDAGTKRYVPNKVSFSGTKLIVSTENPDLYEWAINSPYFENGTNKNPKFRENNPREKAKNRIEREALRNKAMRMVVDEEALPEATLRRILSSTGDNADSYDIDIVREKLMAIVEINPAEFLKMTGGKDVELKALISDLSTKRFIAFDTDKSEWIWSTKVKENGTPFLQVPKGRNEIDWLIDSALRDEALLKGFKILNKQNPEQADKSSERIELETQAKKLKCAAGMHFLTDEKLKEKISITIRNLKAELGSEKIKDERRKEVEGMLGEMNCTLNA